MASNYSRLDLTPLSRDGGSADSQHAVSSDSQARLESRLHLAESLIRQYERGNDGNSRDLQDAMEHLQSALRELRLDSTLRPPILSELCYAHTSEYIRSGSQPALDNAIRYGRLARQEAVMHRFHESASDKHFDYYCRIMNNLGVALSNRAHKCLALENGSNTNSTALGDLDEAIALAREHKSMLEAHGMPCHEIAFNLASRLSKRGSEMRTDMTDRAEALQLLREVQQTAAPTSEMHISAFIKIGELEIEAFKKTGNLQAWKRTLRAMGETVRRIPESVESFPLCHNSMKAAYLDLHQHTGDIVDLVKAVRFSARRLDTNPCPQPLKATYLVAHMGLLRRLALASTSPSEFTAFELEASRHQDRMLRPFPDEFKCRRLHSDVVLKKYLLSKRLEDLRRATFSIYEMLHDESGQTVANGRRVIMAIDGYYKLMKLVARLLRAPRNRAKTVACEAIHTCISGVCKDPNNLIVGLLELTPDVVEVLESYERSAGTGEVITGEVAKERAAKIREEINSGHALAETQSDFSGPLSAIFGFDVTIPMPPQRLAMRQAQVERISVQRAKAEGKHPNPRLCLTCRSLKPLRPVAGRGTFQWNPDMIYLPLGTWEQLRTRRDCSICRLVRSLIATDPESDSQVLHPRLQNTNPEIQGAGLYVGEMEESGERVLAVEYNQRVVGYLKILPNKERITISAYLQAQLTPKGTPHEPESESRKASPEVLKGWLDNCELKHGEACHRSTNPRYTTHIPLVLIDVVDRCLVQGTSSTKYFALSYVRGEVYMPETRRDNYNSRCKSGGLPELPATIEDAMSVVESIGERYLWVDVLCIIQDDRQLKYKILALMDVIYIQAYATIVALSSTNASGGILGVKTPWCRQARQEILTIDVGSPELYWTPGQEKATVELVATPPQLDLVVSTSE